MREEGRKGMFSVTQYGKELDKSKYTWDKNKVFSTTENNLVLDFSDYTEVIFKTGDYCTFKTGHSCTFKTGHSCTFNTGYACTFKTGSECTFKTGDYCTFKTDAYCTFKTDSYCTFNTSSFCTFKTGSYCAFHTGDTCTFKTGNNCVAIRYDVKGITEIPKDITIKLNNYGVSGYTTVPEDKPNTCNGKVVEIDGKKYKLQEIS
jgi:hypothetical protein